jgi:integrase
MSGSTDKPRTFTTALQVKNISEPGMWRDAGAEAPPGLYLQVTPRSERKGGGVSKSWLLRYKIGSPTPRHMGLGSYPTFGLADARDRARAKRQLIEDGIDPIQDRREKIDSLRAEDRQNITFKAAVAKYLKDHNETWRNSKHRQQWANTLSTYASRLNDYRVSSIDDAAINETVAPIWHKIPETAKRTKQRIKTVVQWVKSGMPLPADPTGNAQKHWPALPFIRMPEFIADLRTREGIAPRALELMILCAVRTGDIIGGERDGKPPMMWSHIDFNSRVWTIPSTKTDLEFMVPLSERALEILRSLPRVVGRDCVFPGGASNGSLSNGAMTAVIDRMNDGRKIPDRYTDPKQDNRDVVPHGFRSSFRDWSSEVTRHPHAVCEMALSHMIKSKVEKAYRRGNLLEKRRPLMADWATYCGRRPGGTVVSLREAVAS